MFVCVAPGDCPRSYVQSKTPSLVVTDGPSGKPFIPSGAARSTYARTLLPIVEVAPGESHGSFFENGKLPSETSRGAMNVGLKPGLPPGTGTAPLPIGPS